MADIETPLLPAFIKEPRVFYDRRRGLMCLGKIDGESWLLLHNPATDFWARLRPATDEDARAVEGAMKK